MTGSKPRCRPSAPPPVVPASPSLRSVIENYTIEQLRAGNWNEKSKEENLACYELFLRYAGKNVLCDSIDHALIRDYKATLLKLPANLNKVAKFKDKTIGAILKMRIDTPMSVTTVNKYLNRLSSLLRYAQRNGYMTVNPAEGLQLKQPKRDDELRSVFSHEDLMALFHSPEYREGRHKHSYQFWVPLIALFTGMRQNEIAQLYLDDIRRVDDVWIININADAKDKKLKKGSNARRQIPLHPFLVDGLKLPDYVDHLRCKGHKRLFPEIKPCRDGYGQTVSKWFNGNGISAGYRQRCGLEAPCDGTGRKDFHSFRHTFIDHLKQAQADLAMLHEINGHAHGTMTMDRYGKKYAPSLLLAEVVTKLDWPERLQLDKIKLAWRGYKRE